MVAATASKATQIGRLLSSSACPAQGDASATAPLAVDDLSFVWARDFSFTPSAAAALTSTSALMILLFVATVAVAPRPPTRVVAAASLGALTFYGPNLSALSVAVLSAPRAGSAADVPSAVMGLLTAAVLVAAAGAAVSRRCRSAVVGSKAASGNVAGSSDSATSISSSTDDAARWTAATQPFVEGTREGFADRLCCVVDVAVGVAAAAVSSATYASTATCAASAAAVVALYAAQLCYLLHRRPFVRALDTLLCAVNVAGMVAVSVTTACSRMLPPTSPSRSVAGAASAWIGIALTALFYGELLWELISIVRHWLRPPLPADGSTANLSGATDPLLGAIPERRDTEESMRGDESSVFSATNPLNSMPPIR